MAEYCPGSETRSEADESLTVLLVNLAGLLAGGVVTRLGTRVWARRIEAGQAIFRAENRRQARDRDRRSLPTRPCGAQVPLTRRPG
jgi:hypothetical protein